MKNEITIRAYLGVTQLEMAMLLRITRTQYSMFESGMRSMPRRAVPLYHDLMLMLEGQTDLTVLPEPSKEILRKRHLEKLLKENQFQQMRIARSIAVLSKKEAAQAKAQLLASQLQDRAERQKSDVNTYLHGFAEGASRKFGNAALKRLMEFEVKQELLRTEGLALAQLLNHSQRSNDNQHFRNAMTK